MQHFYALKIVQIDDSETWVSSERSETSGPGFEARNMIFQYILQSFAYTFPVVVNLWKFIFITCDWSRYVFYTFPAVGLFTQLLRQWQCSYS